MRLAVFSDIHGNLPALERMLEHAGSVDGYICLGDTVDYGPWSNECIEMVKSLDNVVVLEGNHEKAFLTGSYPGTNLVAKTFFDFCYPQFNQFESISNLGEEYVLNGYTFKHTINQKYVYPDTKIILDRDYVVGHSHHQFEILQPPFALYNPGSVGQNRQFINVINYALLETEGMIFKMRSLIYDEQLIVKEMEIREYPRLCIDYYKDKQRLSNL